MTQHLLLVFLDLLRQEDFKFKGSLGYISRSCHKRKKIEGFRAAVNLVSYCNHLLGKMCMTVGGIASPFLIGFDAPQERIQGWSYEPGPSSMTRGARGP